MIPVVMGGQSIPMAEHTPLGAKVAHMRAWRERSMRSQTELARDASVSRPTITRAEAGEVISWASIRKIAQALGITPEQLLYDAPPARHRQEGGR